MTPPASGARALGAQPQAPVLTVTLNPALDLAASTERVVPEAKLRCDAPQIDPGGGGINVSRAMARMEGASQALVALGGPTGQRLETLLDHAALPVIRVEAPGDTRESLSIKDRSTGEMYRFVLPGPTWAECDVRAACRAIVDAAPEDGIVVLSGSNPPGVPADLPLRLCEQLKPRRTRLFVDTSGEPLAAVAAARACVSVLRMNDAEAEGLAGRALPTRRDTAQFAAGMVSAGVAEQVIVARAADGNVIATREGCWHAESLPVPIVSKVGAGDSFVAGFTLGMARGWDAADALGLGASAATAAIMTPATELCRPEDVERLFDARIVTPL